MKQLSTKQCKQLDALVADLEDQASKVEDAYVAAEGAVSDYNDAVVALNAFREEIVAAAMDWRDGRSEAWQDGEAGEQHQQWVDAWEEECDVCDEPNCDIPQVPEYPRSIDDV